MQSFRERTQRFSSTFTPAALTTFMVLFAAVPLRIPGIGQVMPALALVNIYYWGVFTPGRLPYVFLFVLGLLQDTLTGAPLGLSSLVNVSFAFLLATERRLFGHSLFGTVWLGFVTLSLIMMMLQWVVMSFYSGRFFPISGLMLQWAMTSLVYPLMHLMLTRIYRWTR